MNKETLKDTAFKSNDNLYNKKIKVVPEPDKEIGIDLNDTVLTNIINSQEEVDVSTFDINALNSFTSVSQSRDQIYQTLDYMAEDSIMAAVLETYAEDATEANDSGDIVWVESTDSNAAKYITYLLNSLCINKHIYGWTHSLCKYGDLYLRLYRESEYENILFKPKENLTDKNLLNEDVKIKAYSKKDKYVHYVEQVENPAQLFELTRFGKTAAYVKTDVASSTTNSDNFNVVTSSFLRKYQFNTSNVELYQPTEFVHASLQDNTSRSPEEVELFIDHNKEEPVSISYKVKRGQSLLYNTYKVWRQLQLLENSVLLNRVTQSSIIRAIGIEVGDMPKESVGPHIAGIKQLIEQKTALNATNLMSEYNNPGPIINNIYVPTRNGKGGLTTTQIGGDVDVKSLADLSYYQDKLFGSLRVPKQYFNIVDDAAGFSGGQSLSIISSRYAKMIKRIQNTMCQAITDIINLILLDTDNQSFINNFTIKMLPPTTQEEVDRRENLVNKVSLVGDIMNTLSDIETPNTKLKILKALLSNTITDPEVIQLLQEEIDRLEPEVSESDVTSDIENEPLGDLESNMDDLFGGDDLSNTPDFGSLESSEPTMTDNENENRLPSPAELDIGDVSDSSNPALN